MTAATIQSVEHIEATPGVIGGKPRIKGTRIGVHDIKIWHLDEEMPVEEICAGYHLSPAQVHAALVYYYDHRDEIDTTIRQEIEQFERMKAQSPSKLQTRLREMQSG